MKKVARLYRMLMSEHMCPFGIKSGHLLERKGYEVVDHPLRSREVVAVMIPDVVPK